MTNSSNESNLSRTDRSLLVLVRGGDEYAAKQLYDRYARRVLGLVEKKLGSRLRSMTDPEDVVQSVFRSMFRGVQAGSYEAPPGATLWNLLAVIAVHKMRRQFAHYTAQRRDLTRTASLESLFESAGADQDSIDFLHICVKEILDSLRPTSQEILSMRIQGFTVDEISERTDRSRRTVERSLQKSREQLASILLDAD